MDATALSQADYLDILYDNRNKKYGSYELRRHYDQRMRKALLMVIAACATIAAYGFISSRNNIHEDNTIRTIPTVITEVIIDHPIIEPPKPTHPAIKTQAVANTLPKIVADTKVTDPPKTVDELAGKEPGKTDVTGDPNGSTPTTIPGTTTTPVLTDMPANTPIKWAETMPEFNGNLNDYLQKQLQYPDKAREMSVEGKVSVQFVVNEDGSVSNARIIRGIGAGCDEEAVRVINSMPKWKPGKQNDRAVKVFYTLPILFVLQ